MARVKRIFKKISPKSKINELDPPRENMRVGSRISKILLKIIEISRILRVVGLLSHPAEPCTSHDNEYDCVNDFNDAMTMQEHSRYLYKSRF